jgi:hypothetical protein
MQMRRCAVWSCLSVLGLCLVANPAWAAPKKKKHSKQADSAEPAATEAVDQPAARGGESGDIDSLMKESTKNKPAPVKKQEVAEPDPDKPLYNDDGSTASAWERPPTDAEKPKKKQKSTERAVETKPKGDGRHMNLGILAGYGLSLGSGLTSLNPYGLGVGLQGDYELENRMVIGVGGEFFLGGSDPNATNNNGVRREDYARYILGHALVGYNIWFSDNLYLRPSIWLGVAIAMIPSSPAHQSGIAVTALIGPGLTLHYILGPSGWYLGGDIHVSIPVGQANSTKTGMPVLVTFGKRF